ncbi:MAG: DUF3298 domain-containing protein [Acaryochloris sp. SU_5_25]|nr:DUF3298 domain-containing protein [Acaryochloris sp. SU_5_25]
MKGYAPKLNTIAEKHFRQVRKLAANESLNRAGFWFEKDQFQVNANFAIAPQGLILFFNPYEIGPYVLGSTEIQIPYIELQTLIKDKTLLSPP